MRVAAICLVATGLALPRLTSEHASWLGQSGASTVFVIDNSLSMSARSGGITLLERSKQAVLTWIELLGSARRAALVPLHGEVSPLTTDHQALAEAVRQIESTHLATRLGAALERAVTMLESEEAPVRQIVVVSDFSRRSPPPEITLPERTTCIALHAAAAGGASLAIQEIRAEADVPPVATSEEPAEA